MKKKNENSTHKWLLATCLWRRQWISYCITIVSKWRGRRRQQTQIHKHTRRFELRPHTSGQLNMRICYYYLLDIISTLALGHSNEWQLHVVHVWVRWCCYRLVTLSGIDKKRATRKGSECVNLSNWSNNTWAMTRTQKSYNVLFGSFEWNKSIDILIKFHLCTLRWLWIKNRSSSICIIRMLHVVHIVKCGTYIVGAMCDMWVNKYVYTEHWAIRLTYTHTPHDRLERAESQLVIRHVWPSKNDTCGARMDAHDQRKTRWIE